jgi:hypothetical protein
MSSGGGRGAEELQCGKKFRKEGGFLPPGSMAFIDEDKDGPAWGHNRLVQPPGRFCSIGPAPHLG